MKLLLNIDVPDLVLAQVFYLEAFGWTPGRSLGEAVLELVGLDVPVYLLCKEAGTVAWIKEHVKPGQVFLDVGANIGLYTILAGKHVGSDGLVYAFEPHLGNALRLMKNVRENGLDAQVKVLSVALNDTSGFIDFNYQAELSGSSMSQLGSLRDSEERQFDGEDRILVPSPKVATYDLMPEMSAPEVTDKLVEAIGSGLYDLVVVNYANTDMVGHSGILPAAIKAVEAVDACLGRLVEAVRKAGGVLLITADHGNAEQMYDEKTHQKHTQQTLNRVPALLFGAPANIRSLSDK